MHVIRLRKPWTKTLTKTLGESSMVTRIEVPEPCVSESSDLVADYRRRFNRPSRIQNARVFLQIASWEGRLTALSLNGAPIPVDGSETCVNTDITSLIQSHNELLVTLSGTAGTPPRLSGEVSLGIEDEPTT